MAWAATSFPTIKISSSCTRRCSVKSTTNGLNIYVIVGLDGIHHPVPFEKDECQALLQTSKDKLRELNKRIESEIDSPEHLANPTPESCQSCLQRPICKAYFLKRKTSTDEGWPNDVWGTLTEKKTLLNGLGKITLNPPTGGALNPIRIRSLQLQRHPALECCQKMGVFSLIPDSSRDCYMEGLFTTIYGTDLLNSWNQGC